MSDDQSKKADSPERRLAEQLKRDALADRPTFSAGLHNRVMAGIVARDNSPTLGELLSVARKRNPLRRAIQWATIAAVILIGLFAIDQFRRRGDRVQEVTPRDEGLGGIAIVSPHPRSELSFDDLDHTAGIALRLVVDQLPIEVPADDWDCRPSISRRPFGNTSPKR
ncbi:MAG TPA: hypothetical protein VGH32_01110 [Pirellulales bacterium]